MAKYPDRRSAAIPALHAVQHDHGWCSPEAIEQAACVMRLTPGYLIAVATLLRHARHAPGRRAPRLRVHEHLVLAVRRRRAATTRFATEVGDDPDFNVRAFECLGACDIAPMASVDGAYVGPIALDEVPDARRADPHRRGAAARQAALAPHVRRPEGSPAVTDVLLFKDIDEPGLAHARGLRAPRRLRAAAQGAGDDAARRSSHELDASACAAAAAPASRWARRPRSCPRARWTSTSSATPTSPSPARSRTASSCRRARTC